MSESVLKRQREIEGEWKKYRLCIVFLMHSLPIDLVYGQKNNKKYKYIPFLNASKLNTQKDIFLNECKIYNAPKSKLEKEWK